MMSDKTGSKEWWERLRFDKAFHLGLGDVRVTIGMQEELQDRIAELEEELHDANIGFSAAEKLLGRAEKQRDELAAALREVADSHFDLSLHKQHDTLTHLKHMAQKALANQEKTDDA